jgi:uncharacterized protein (TIGR02246 family)
VDSMTNASTPQSSTTPAIPPVIGRYLAAADDQDAEALASCFAPDGTVTDEGTTYRGHDEIVAWRTQTLTKWTYTSRLTGTEVVADDEHLAFVHVAGNFPGGQADLTYRFMLAGDSITSLSIVE